MARRLVVLALAAAAAATAISMPGHWGRARLSSAIAAIVASDSVTAAGVSVGKCSYSTGSLARSSPGSGSG